MLEIDPPSRLRAQCNVLAAASLAALVAAASLCPGPSAASQEVAVQVAQPIVIESGYQVSAVTYVRSLGGPEAGYALFMIDDENCTVGETGSTRDRNAAHIGGARVTSASSRGDTLSVTLDLAQLQRTPKPAGSLEGVVDATIECILLTASWHRHGLDSKGAPVYMNHVQIDVVGDSSFVGRSEVFSFDTMGDLPRKRFFH